MLTTAPDIAGTVTTGLDGLVPQLLTVGEAGLGVAFVIWGLPKAVRFFKRVAS